MSAIDNRPNRVVVLGSLNMDLIVRTEHLPAPGETVLGGRFSTAPGGKGANQAVAAARLGARVSIIGAVGADDYGRQLLGGAESDGVDVSHVRDVNEPSGVALIVVDAGGQNLIAVAPGANGEVVPSMVESADRAIRESDVLVAQLETPRDAIVTAAGIARHAGVPFVLNAAPARPDIGELLSLVTVLVVNESELAIILGHVVPEGQEGAAARQLLELGPSAVIVTLGARGSV
ncbi:MAG TPA: ribokinase, partial [Chloroflexota bacterium]